MQWDRVEFIMLLLDDDYRDDGDVDGDFLWWWLQCAPLYDWFSLFDGVLSLYDGDYDGDNNENNDFEMMVLVMTLQCLPFLSD